MAQASLGLNWSKMYAFVKSGDGDEARFRAYGPDWEPLTESLRPTAFVWWALLTQQNHMTHMEYLVMGHLMEQVGLGPTIAEVTEAYLMRWPVPVQ